MPGRPVRRIVQKFCGGRIDFVHEIEYNKFELIFIYHSLYNLQDVSGKQKRTKRTAEQKNGDRGGHIMHLLYDENGNPIPHGAHDEHHHHHDEECGCGHDHDHDEHEHHHHDHDGECGCGHDHDHEHHHHHDGECGCGHEHHHHHADEVFTSWGRETIKKFTREGLEKILEALSESDKYGIILRAKGMLPAEDGTWIYFDMVPEETEIREGAPEYTGRLCVIGSKLDEHALEELFGIA